jgi:hypothetical protein
MSRSLDSHKILDRIRIQKVHPVCIVAQDVVVKICLCSSMNPPKVKYH